MAQFDSNDIFQQLRAKISASGGPDQTGSGVPSYLDAPALAPSPVIRADPSAGAQDIMKGVNAVADANAKREAQQMRLEAAALRLEAAQAKADAKDAGARLSAAAAASVTGATSTARGAGAKGGLDITEDSVDDDAKFFDLNQNVPTLTTSESWKAAPYAVRRKMAEEYVRQQTSAFEAGLMDAGVKKAEVAARTKQQKAIIEDALRPALGARPQFSLTDSDWYDSAKSAASSIASGVRLLTGNQTTAEVTKDLTDQAQDFEVNKSALTRDADRAAGWREMKLRAAAKAKNGDEKLGAMDEVKLTYENFKDAPVRTLMGQALPLIAPAIGSVVGATIGAKTGALGGAVFGPGGAAAGGLIGGGVGGFAGGATVGAVLEAGGAVSDVISTIAQIDDAELLANPTFQKTYEANGKDMARARTAFSSDIAEKSAGYAGLLGAGFGALDAVTGFGGRAVKGAIAATGKLTAREATQSALASVGLRTAASPLAKLEKSLAESAGRGVFTKAGAAVKDVVVDSAKEAAEEGSMRVSQNVALRDSDIKVGLTEGAYGDATLGGLIGGGVTVGARGAKVLGNTGLKAGGYSAGGVDVDGDKVVDFKRGADGVPLPGADGRYDLELVKRSKDGAAANLAYNADTGLLRVLSNADGQDASGVTAETAYHSNRRVLQAYGVGEMGAPTPDLAIRSELFGRAAASTMYGESADAVDVTRGRKLAGANELVDFSFNGDGTITLANAAKLSPETLASAEAMVQSVESLLRPSLKEGLSTFWNKTHGDIVAPSVRGTPPVRPVKPDSPPAPIDPAAPATVGTAESVESAVLGAGPATGQPLPDIFGGDSDASYAGYSVPSPLLPEALVNRDFPVFDGPTASFPTEPIPSPSYSGLVSGGKARTEEVARLLVEAQARGSSAVAARQEADARAAEQEALLRSARANAQTLTAAQVQAQAQARSARAKAEAAATKAEAVAAEARRVAAAAKAEADRIAARETDTLDSLIGKRVNYGPSVTGVLYKTDEGYFVGDDFVERGESGASAAELGITEVANQAPRRSPVQDALAAARQREGTPVDRSLTPARTMAIELGFLTPAELRELENYRPVEDAAFIADHRQIADVYDAMPETDENAAAAYAELAEETQYQYGLIASTGITVEAWYGDGEPYANSNDMRADIAKGHLFFLPTQSAFGETNELDTRNPMLSSTEETVPATNGTEHPMLLNDMFRVVHDWLAHGVSDNGFGPLGEEKAWRIHMATLKSDGAKRALTAETRGQNSWVNYGPHLRNEEGNFPRRGDPDYVPATERPFAEQKLALLPDWTMDYTLAGAPAPNGEFNPLTGEITADPETQRAVWLHEVWHKRGEELMKEYYSDLTNSVKRWSTRPVGTVERTIHDTAKARAAKSGAYNMEFLAYAIETAVENGVTPNTNPDTMTAGGWLAKIKSAFTRVMAKFNLAPPGGVELSAKDLVTIAYAAARLEVTNSPYSLAANPQLKAYYEATGRNLYSQGVSPRGTAAALANAQAGNQATLATTGRKLRKSGSLSELWSNAGTFFGEKGLSAKELFVDGLTPVLTQIEKVPPRLSEVGEGLKRYMYLAPDRRDNARKDAAGVYGGQAVYDALGRMSKLKNEYVETTIRDAGNWLTGTYALIKNERMMQQDELAVQEAERQLAATDPTKTQTVAKWQRAVDAAIKVRDDRAFAFKQPANSVVNYGPGSILAKTELAAKQANLDALIQSNAGPALIDVAEAALVAAQNELKQHEIGLAGGMNEAQAQAYIKLGVSKYGKNALEAMAKNMYRVNSYALLLDLESGRTSPQLAAAFSPEIAALLPDMVRIVNMAKDDTVKQADLEKARARFVETLASTSKYVPTTGSPKESFDEIDVLGSGFRAPNVATDKRLEGRTASQADDGITASFGRLQRSAAAYGWNPFARTVAELYNRSTPDERASMGMTRTEANILTRLGDDVVIFEGHGYTFGDGRALAALRKDNVDGLDPRLGVAGTALRGMSYMMTQLNLPFAPKNMVRDVWERSENLRARDLYAVKNGQRVKLDSNAVASAMLKKAGKGKIQKELIAHFWSKTGQGENAEFVQLYREMMERGAGGSRRSAMLSPMKSDMVKDIDRVRTAPGQALKALGTVVERWNLVFDAVAATTAYASMREAGMGKDEAAFQALDLMNFRKMGTVMPLVRLLYVFANPAVQGGYNLTRTLKTRTGQVRFLGYLAAYLTLQAALAALAGDDDETGKNRIDVMSEYTKDHSLPIPIGGDNVFKLPVGYGLPMVANIFARIGREVYTGDSTITGALSDIVSRAIVPSITPLEDSKIKSSDSFAARMVQTFAPSVLEPVLNVAINRGSFGQMLVNDAYLDGDKFKSEQGSPYTAEEFVTAARVLREMTSIDMAPEHIKAIIEGYVSGLPKDVLKTLITNPNKASLGQKFDIPILETFVSGYNNAALIGELARFEEEGGQLMREANLKLKGVDKEDMEEALDTYASNLGGKDGRMLEAYIEFKGLMKEFQQASSAMTRAGVGKSRNAERAELAEAKQITTAEFIRRVTRIRQGD